jgi:hypothetical protein
VIPLYHQAVTMDPTGGGKGGSAFTRHLRLGELVNRRRDAPLSPRGRWIYRLVLAVVIVGGILLIALSR